MYRANRKYKDSLFKDLFHDEAAAIELYNALTGSHYTVGDGLSFTTLEDALFMSQLNDISFTIGDRLVILVEHQASLNRNMPLRALMYIGRVYEKIIDRKATYRSTLLKVPTPEFYVLYNGTEDYPDADTLRLSDAFMYADISGINRFPAMELVVRVININKGHSREILERSGVLNSYAVFVGQVRDHRKRGLELEDAITAAIDYCMANGILVEYLKNNGSEVRNMLFTEFNLEDAKEVWFEEGVEKGIAKGIEKGIEKGIAKGIEKGIVKGIEEGIEKGIEKGRNEAMLENAKAMFADGLSIEQIVRITRIPMDILKEKLPIQ